MSLGSRTDERLRLLADASNRAIVTALDEAEQPLHVEELADCLVSRDVSVVEAVEYEQRLEQTLISLHHNRLPKLAEAGLLEYEPETNVVAPRNPVSFDVNGREATTIDELVAHLGIDHGASEADIGVIEGREAAIEYGRQLAAEAEEELFCMYVSTDLLEDECVRRGQQAIDRGVTMYMGSQNPEVRELTRHHLPEAILWEPQLDWLNTPSYPRIGRLVFIDRRKLMLAILEEPDAERTHPEETAVVAEGTDHPLVVLVRELLGARLDHLDYQTESFASELPS